MTVERNSVERRKNRFEFALFINDYKVVGKIFPADCYSPAISQSVDIRHLDETIQSTLKNVLSGSNLEKGKFVTTYLDKNLTRQSKNQNFNSNRDNKFEWVLFKNGSRIIGRVFQLENYNPMARQSFDLIEKVDSVVNLIEYDLKIKDFLYQTSDEGKNRTFRAKTKGGKI